PTPRWLESVDGRALAGLLSVTAAPDGRIFAVEGSAGRTPDQWRHDLMERRQNGRLIGCGAALDQANVVLGSLHYPYGGSIGADGKLWFTEAWAHRMCRMSASSTAQPEIVAQNMPGYPARLHPDGKGGFYLGVFARRTHLIEFVLKEDDFREEMISTM